MNRFARGMAVAALVSGATIPAVSRGQLPPDKELATLAAAAEFDVTLFASEPLITNPAAIDVDTHGRVWVAEIQWYRGAAKDPPADKIKVLEDTDGDGAADKVTVFADGLFAPMSVCVAGNRVYVATSPDLWVFEDNDGDLKADGPPKKLLTGFGGRNHDHGAHSLVLGPDHKWWMSHGDTGFDVTGSDGSRIKYQWGAVLRGELDGSKLETVAVNFRNPYEVCVNSFGEAFLSDNDNDGNESVRICWIMEGGNYGWFGGPPFGKQELGDYLPADAPYREHWHFRGHIPGFVPATLVTGFGSPCGICFYEGDTFGPKYQNAPLHADAGPRLCRAFRHQPAGFGMKATSEVFLANQGDDYFRPDDVCAAPDGRLFVSDWYDGGVGGHGYNNPEQGRIFMLAPKGRKSARHEKPGPYTSVADAIEGLKSPNLATQFLAREQLLSAGNENIAALTSLLSDAEPNYRARALWLLDRIGGDARISVIEQLESPAPEFRALAVRILRRHGDDYADAILNLVGDSSEQVRREVLLAIRTLSGSKAEAALATIAANYDGTDRYLLEAINIAAGDRREALLARLEQNGQLPIEQFSLLQLLAPKRAAAQLVARLDDGHLDDKAARVLLESAVNIPAVEAGWGLLKLAQDSNVPDELRKSALQKVVVNVNRRGGWSAMARDRKFVDAIGVFLADDALRLLALRATDELRLKKLSDPVLAVAWSGNLDSGTRAQAIDVAARLKSPGIAAALRQFVGDPDPVVSAAALRGLVEMQDIRSLREIIASDQLSTDARRHAVEQAVETTSGAILLLKLIDDHQLPEDLQEAVLAKATTHADSNVRGLYEKFVPAGERAKRLGAAISADEILALSGDANRGRLIFFKNSAAQCKQCHAVQGFGGTLGPELTNIGKKYERKALLETILDPSKAIAPEYTPYLLETKSGQVYAGFLVARQPEGVVLKDVKNETLRVPTDEVEALVPQTKSLMPELILSEVTAQDAADLLAFLATLK
jgi:putative membrane-bound dehydrogenase-like protein